MPQYRKNIAENRKARFDYSISDTVEAGIVLKGDEVKSVRIGRVNLRDSFARIEKGGVYLYGMHISPYNFARKEDAKPLRVRKLLLKKSQINNLEGKINQKGFSLIPLKIYFSGNYAKVELGLAKGKREFDKKEKIKKRDIDRDVSRELAGRDN